MVESSAKVRPWREAVKAAAPAGPPLLDGPVLAGMVFTMKRPASARKLQVVPSTRPDLSKLVRSTEDAITDAGLWADDARVAAYPLLAKVWWPNGPFSLPTSGAVVGAVPWALGPATLLDLMFEAARTAQRRFEEPA
jgi:hypothetical protein